MNVTDQQQLDAWLKESTKKSGVPLKVKAAGVIAQVGELTKAQTAEQ